MSLLLILSEIYLRRTAVLNRVAAAALSLDISLDTEMDRPSRQTQLRYRKTDGRVF